MAVGSAIIGWIGVGMQAYNLYQYLFSNDGNKKQDYKYSDGALQTKCDNNASIPIIYGTVKTAGNLVYTRMSGDNTYLYKLVSLSIGEVSRVYDIRFNDLPYNHFSDTGVNTYVGDGIQGVDSVVVAGDATERVKTVGGMRQEAYVAAWAKASEELGGDYNLTCIVDGRLIRVFSSSAFAGATYDPSIGYYFQWKFSNNPAWVILDFLSLPNGCGVSLKDVDIDGFINAAVYFDEPPKTGGPEHRFTLNLRIDEKRSKLDWITEMMMACQSYPTYCKGKFGILVEKEEEVSQTYTPEMINGLTVWWSELDDIADIARIGYVEPAEEWVKIYASAEANPYIRPAPYIKDVDILGVTNFNQASRLAWFYLNQSTTCTQYVSFKTDRRALNRSIGDVINLEDDYVTSLEELDKQGKRYRIYKMVEHDGGSIELFCREYNPYVYRDLLGSAPPVINSSDLPNPFDAVPDILGFEDGISQLYMVQKDKSVISQLYGTAIIAPYPYFYQLRILYMEIGVDDKWKEVGTSISGDFTVNGVKVGSTYKLLIYTESSYGLRSKGYITEDIYITGFNEAPAKPRNLKAEEVAGGWKLTWTANSEPDIDGYDIYEGLNCTDEYYRVAQQYAGTTYNYSTDRIGQFIFWVRAVDTSGNLSEPASVIVSKIPPRPVQDFDVFQNGRKLDFRWSQTESERGRVAYEIRRGESWDLGELIGMVTGTCMSISYYSLAYTHKFWIKSMNSFGVYSEYASCSTIGISPQPNRNMVFQDKPKESENGWNGSGLGVKIVNRGLMLESGVKYGEKFQREILPDTFDCRNWVDCNLIGIKDDFLIWKNANFNWGTSLAKSPWLPKGQTINASFSHQFARKRDALDPEWKYIESIPMDGNLIPQLGGTVASSTNVKFQDGKFFKGGFMGETTFVSWNKNIPAIFSLSFNLRMDLLMDYSCSILRLTDNSGLKGLSVGYSSLDKMFYLTDNFNVMRVKPNFSKKDIFSFAISQTKTKRRFYVIVFSEGVYKMVDSEELLPPVGSFTKIYTYGMIGLKL